MYAVELIVDSLGPNPEYDKRRPQTTDNMPSLIVPAGTILRGPEVYVHCLPDATTKVVRAKPADEATKKVVDTLLERRAEMLRKRAAKDKAQVSAAAAAAQAEVDELNRRIAAAQGK